MFGIFMAMSSGIAAADYIKAPAFVIWGIVGISIIMTYLLRKEGRLLPFFALLFIFVSSFGYFQWMDEGNRSAIPGVETFHANMEGRIVSEVRVDGDRARWVMQSDTVFMPFNGSLQRRVNMEGEKVQVVLKLRTKHQWEAVQQWQRGSLIRLKGDWERPRKAGNPGALDYEIYLHRQHIHWIVNVDGADSITFAPLNYAGESSLVDKTGLALMQQFDHFRGYLNRQVEAIFPIFSQGFMKGILLGTRDDLETDRLESFSLLGLTHVLAISGMHVGLVVGGWIWLCRRLGLTHETTLRLTWLVIPFYIVVTGAEPSAIRAGIMAMIGITALLMKQWKNGLSILGFTGCIMLLWNPYYLFNIGFQLSFLITAGIIWGVSKINRKIPVHNEWIRSAISITLTAQCFSFPMTVYYFNQFSLLSFAANLFLVPVMTLIILPVGYAALFLGMIHPGFGYLLGKMVNTTLWSVYWIVDRLSGWAYMHQIWATPPKWWMVVYFALFLSLISFWEKGDNRIHPLVKRKWQGNIITRKLGKRRWVAPVLLLLMIVHLAYGYAYPGKREAFQATFIDVGQGDSLLIETPKGTRILVDGGGTLDFSERLEEWQKRKKTFEVGKQVLVPYLKRNGIRHLDYVFATHGDIDHIGGLRAVLSELYVTQLVWGTDSIIGPEVTELFQIAQDNEVKVVQAVRGQRWKIEEGIDLLVLHPTHESGKNMEGNNQSLVLLMNIYGKTMMLTGDIEVAAEHRILDALEENQFRPNIDIMKVAHHGSRTSTTQRWMNYFKPKVAVISVGHDNRFGHPTAEVIERLEAAQTQIYRTDVHGAVTVTMDRMGRVELETTLR
jgi:competence protein ComEC